MWYIPTNHRKYSTSSENHFNEIFWQKTFDLPTKHRKYLTSSMRSFRWWWCLHLLLPKLKWRWKSFDAFLSHDICNPKSEGYCQNSKICFLWTALMPTYHPTKRTALCWIHSVYHPPVNSVQVEIVVHEGTIKIPFVAHLTSGNSKWSVPKSSQSVADIQLHAREVAGEYTGTDATMIKMELSEVGVKRTKKQKRNIIHSFPQTSLLEGNRKVSRM